MWENGGMAAFGTFLKAVLWQHGGRRALVMTVPSLLLGAVALAGYFYPALSLQGRVFPWWSWALAISVGLLLASYSAWHEQFSINKKLYDRPDVTLTCRYRSRDSPGFAFKDFPGFQVLLKNAGQHTAVNITALPIVLEIPERVKLDWQSVQEQANEVPTQWIVSFRSVDRLGALNADGDMVLEYRIENQGPLQQCLSHILSEIAGTDFRSAIPLTLVFSNIGDPQRAWHAHYELQYYIVRKTELIARFLGYKEVPIGKDSSASTLSRAGFPQPSLMR
jgi:hypothetical protein